MYVFFPVYNHSMTYGHYITVYAVKTKMKKNSDSQSLIFKFFLNLKKIQKRFHTTTCRSNQSLYIWLALNAIPPYDDDDDDEPV